MKRIGLFMTCLLFILLCAVGCGMPSPDAPDNDLLTKPLPTQEASAPSYTTEDIDIRQATSSNNQLNVYDYVTLGFDLSSLEQPDEEGHTIYYYTNSILYTTASCGNKLYRFAHFQMKEPTDSFVLMFVFDMDTREMECHTLNTKLLEREGDLIASVTTMNNEKLSFRMYSPPPEDETTGSYYLLETDMDCNVLNVVEPYPEEETYPWNLPFSLQRTDYSVYGCGDGSFFMREWDDVTETTHLYDYVPETNTKTLIASLKQVYTSSPCTLDKENFYFNHNGYLQKYNVTEDTTEVLCNIKDMGLPSESVSSCKILINEAGDIALADLNGEEWGVYYLTDEEVVNTEKSQITFVNLSEYEPVYAKQQAASFSSRSHTVSVAYETAPAGNFEAYHDRIIMELVSGNGPDIMWVTEEDLRILAEKGTLMDLSELLSEDIKEPLFPGVLQLGTIHDKLVGIAPEIAFTTVITSNQVWSEDTWTIADIVATAKTREDWKIPFFFNIWPADAPSIFYGILATDWNHTPYMNMEQGISHFNEQEFIDSLQLCQKYGRSNTSAYDNDTIVNMLHDGDSIAQLRYIYDGIIAYSAIMNQCSNKCHLVGFPTEEGSGHYLFSDGYLVVNAATEHPEAVSELLSHILGYKSQFEVNYCSVRRDVVADSIFIDDFDDTAYVKKTASGYNRQPIETKADGSTYLPEFLEFCESCVPKPYCPTAITEIIGEETTYFYGGSKSAENVAELIHRRVQLYFDENH